MHIARRRLVAGLAATVLGAACGGGDDSASTEPPSTTADTDGQVTFVDDRGVGVSFPDEPRIVAWQTIVPALVELGIEPVGVIAFNDLATNPGFIDAGVDVEDLVAVSTSYGEVDIEALAALDPDVILTYDLDGDLLQGFTDAGTQDLAEQVAPFIALDSGAPVETGIERMEELAGLMGADLSSAEHAEDVAAFDRAVEDLHAVVAERDGLQVAFGGPAPSGLFVAPIDSYPELQFYRDLGLAVTDGPQDAVVSWELVDGLDADVFMIDDRTTPEELAEADQVPTWGSIPAVAAGQAVIGWRFLLSYSRAEYARSIERLLPVLRSADAGVS